MLFDIARFNSCTVRVLGEEGDVSIGEYLRRKGYPPQFKNNYLVACLTFVASPERCTPDLGQAAPHLSLSTPRTPSLLMRRHSLAAPFHDRAQPHLAPSTSASDLAAMALGLTSGSDASSALGQYRCGVYDR